ncbi:ankyrin repeat-containing domain protein [Mariannaea sp. PMI_226]|nr:ankyrin repeat-containing domain protein [Mariannaea sp. PMI_226]
MWKKLNRFMPEYVRDEHFATAEALSNGSGVWQLLPALSILLFFSSNNLTETAYTWSAKEYLETDQAMVWVSQLFQTAGVLSKDTFPSQQPTIHALFDRIFEAAIRIGSIDTLKILRETGYDLQARINLAIDVSHLSIQNHLLRSENVYLATTLPITHSLYYGDGDMVRFLILNGANTSLLNKYNVGNEIFDASYSVFDVCTWPENPKTRNEMVALILTLSQGIPVCHLFSGLCNLFYYSNLQSTSDPEQDGHVAANLILSYLWDLERSCKLNHPNKILLLHAARFGREDIVAALISGMEAPSLEDLADLSRPLADAAGTGRRKICEMLLAAGAKVDHPDGFMPSALHLAAMNGDLGILDLLISHGSNINLSFQKPKSTCAHMNLELTQDIQGSALNIAIQRNHNEAALFLLSIGAQYFENDLHVAVREGNPVLVKELLERNLAPSANMILEAIKQENPEMIDCITRFNISCNVIGDLQESALAAAIISAKQSLVENVLSIGPDEYDASALLAATYTAHKSKDISIISLMLRRRALQQQPKTWDRFLEGIALATSIFFGDIKTTELLLDNKIRISRNPEGDSLSQREYLGKFDLHKDSLAICSDKNQVVQVIGYQFSDSPILVAIRSNQPDVVLYLQNRGFQSGAKEFTMAENLGCCVPEILMEAAERVNLRDEDDDTLLQAVIKSKVCSSELIDYLLQQGADINAPPACRSRYWQLPRTALQAASEKGDIELTRKLIAAGADINHPAAEVEGATALQLAAIHGHLQIAKLLVENGADYNANGARQYGRTALEGAAELGHIEMVKYLLCIGVETRGIHSFPYLRAILLAEKECKFSAANILRSHRPWNDSDKGIFEILSHLTKISSRYLEDMWDVLILKGNGEHKDTVDSSGEPSTNNSRTQADIDQEGVSINALLHNPAQSMKSLVLSSLLPEHDFEPATEQVMSSTDTTIPQYENVQHSQDSVEEEDLFRLFINFPDDD